MSRIMFVDEKNIFFFSEMKKIKTTGYKEIVQRYVPVTSRYIMKHNQNNHKYVENKCLSVFHQMKSIRNFQIESKNIRIFVICLNGDLNNRTINKFVEEFVSLSSNSISYQKDLLNIQNYPLNEVINHRRIKYYTTDSSLDNFMQYFILMNTEGVVLTSQNVNKD